MPIAPSCVEISSTVQTKKNSKLNITPNATLYGEIKIHDFPPISRFISELMQDRAIVTMEGESKPQPSFRMVPISMTFSDL